MKPTRENLNSLSRSLDFVDAADIRPDQTEVSFTQGWVRQ